MSNLDVCLKVFLLEGVLSPATSVMYLKAYAVGELCLSSLINIFKKSNILGDIGDDLIEWDLFALFIHEIYDCINVVINNNITCECQITLLRCPRAERNFKAH